MRSGRGWCPWAIQIEGVTTYDNRQLQPVGFCDHTAGGFLSTMKDPNFWNNAGVSTHFAIGRTGEVVQLVNVFEIAFAQGRLGPVVTWPHWRELGSPNPNLLFISTEHEDWVLDGRTASAVPGSQWTQAQFDADLKLKRWCYEEYAKEGVNLLQYGIESLTGHYMFDGVNRAECPGKFWRDEYRLKLFTGLGVPPGPVAPVEGDDMDPKVKALIAAAFILSIGNPITDLSPDDRAAIKAVVAALGD